MDILSLDIIWLILLLFTVNFIAVLFVGTEERYWLPSSLLWIFLITCLLLLRTLNKDVELNKEYAYTSQQDKESEAYTTALIDWEKTKDKHHSQHKMLLRLAGFQTFFCFLCQLLGYGTTRKPRFKKGAISFALFFLLYVTIEFINLLT